MIQSLNLSTEYLTKTLNDQISKIVNEPDFLFLFQKIKIKNSIKKTILDKLIKTPLKLSYLG